MVCDFFHPNAGGVENHIYAVSACLAIQGHTVVVATHAYGDRTGVRWIEPGIKVYYLPLIPVYNQATAPVGMASIALLRAVLLRNRIELVHGHSAFSALANDALVLAQALGLASVFTDHSLFGFGDMSSILTNKLLKFHLRCVSRVICVSQTGRVNTMMRSQASGDVVEVIPNAIDPAAFRPDPCVGASESSDPIHVVVMSRLVYRKGIDLLAQLIPRLCTQFPRIHFTVGGDGPKRVVLEQMRERHKLLDRVHMLGHVPHTQVRNVLAQGHLFLNTSLTEAFCIAIVEAASAGLLVVSTKVGGVPEVLPSDMLLLAEPTVDDLVNVVGDAIPLLATRTAEVRIAQHRRVATMYDWRDVATKTESAYAVALAQPRLDLIERMIRTAQIGVIAGPVLACYLILVQLYLLLLAWLCPVDIALVERSKRAKDLSFK